MSEIERHNWMLDLETRATVQPKPVSGQKLEFYLHTSVMKWSILCESIPRNKNGKLSQKTNNFYEAVMLCGKAGYILTKISLKALLPCEFTMSEQRQPWVTIGVFCFVFLLSSNIHIFLFTHWFRLDLIFFLLAHPPTCRVKIRSWVLGKAIALMENLERKPPRKQLHSVLTLKHYLGDYIQLSSDGKTEKHIKKCS